MVLELPVTRTFDFKLLRYVVDAVFKFKAHELFLSLSESEPETLRILNAVTPS